MGESHEHYSCYQRLKQRADEYAEAFPGCDWELVFRFYAALHIADAFLKTKGERFSAENHVERWRAIRRSPEMQRGSAHAAYKGLREISEQVRYHPEFQATSLDRENANAHLSKIESVWGTMVRTRLESGRAG